MTDGLTSGETQKNYENFEKLEFKAVFAKLKESLKSENVREQTNKNIFKILKSNSGASFSFRLPKPKWGIFWDGSRLVGFQCRWIRFCVVNVHKEQKSTFKTCRLLFRKTQIKCQPLPWHPLSMKTVTNPQNEIKFHIEKMSGTYIVEPPLKFSSSRSYELLRA